MERVKMNYQVAVVGGGPGGFSAAITAARKGMKTVLIERNSFIGGTAAAGIPFLGFWDKHHHRIVRGFGEEVVERFVKEGISEGHRYCPKHQSVVCFKPDKAKLIYAEMLREAGVDVILHAELIDAHSADGKVQYIEVAARSKRLEIYADIFVDTADGDIAYFSGAEYEKGDEQGKTQPPSILFTINNVDEEKFLQFLEENPEEQGSYKMEYLRKSRNYCYVGLTGLYNRLKKTGEWPMEIWAAIIVNSPNPGEVFINGPRMGGTDATDPLSITNAELLGQRQAHEFVEVLRKYIPGYENAQLSAVNASSVCIRETRRVKGVKQLTVDTVVRGFVGEDTIALGGYPIDIHGNDETSRFIPFERPYGIPYLATVSATRSNLMLSGRCISADSKSFGSVRVMAQCMAVGQAVGTAAAMAIRANILPKDVDVAELRKELLADNALLELNEEDIIHEDVYGF